MSAVRSTSSDGQQRLDRDARGRSRRLTRKVEPPSAVSSANARSRADSNRSSRRFSRHRRTTRSNTVGSAPLALLRPPGSSLRIAFMRLDRRFAFERPPARQHLVENRPEREDVRPCDRRERPLTCSGDMYPTVPSRVPAAVIAEAVSTADRAVSGSRTGRSFARPKSRIFTRPSSVTKTFSGFRSRWTIPLSWAAARPRAI